MKFKSVLVFSIVGSMLLTGCSNIKKESTFDQAMSEGKLAIASKDFDKAEGMFSLAVQENEKDKEANALYNQTLKLVEANKLIEQDKLDEAKSKLEELKNIDSDLVSLKDAADKLLEYITSKSSNSEESIKEELKNIKKLVDEGKYEDAIDSCNELIKNIGEEESLKEYIKEINGYITTCNKSINQVNEKKRESKENKQSENDKPDNSGKVYCKNGSHYVKEENYDPELNRCTGCSIARDLTSSSLAENCTSCGGEFTVYRMTGVCSQCNAKVLKAVKEVKEDGTVILEDGSVF